MERFAFKGISLSEQSTNKGKTSNKTGLNGEAHVTVLGTG